MLTPTIQTLALTYLVGLKADVSQTENKTQALWQSFGPLQATVKSRANANSYSIEVYPKGYFKNYNPATRYTQWAAIAVEEAPVNLPSPLQYLVLPRGFYAVFIYTGVASGVASLYQRIYTQWLPKSGHALDHRPHLAIMPTDYNPISATAKEEIWIPIKPNTIIG